MKKLLALGSFVLMIVLEIAGCGGGGGGGGGGVGGGASAPNSLPTSAIALSSDKNLALADGNDMATITATVKKDGVPVPAGTPVTFAITSGNGILTPVAGGLTDATGKATATLSHPMVSAPAVNETVNLTATAVGVTSAAVSVKFINQPTSVDVFFAMTPAIPAPGVVGLAFTIEHTGSAVYAKSELADETLKFVAAGGSVFPPIANAFTQTQTRFASIQFTGAGTGLTTVDRSPVFTLSYNVVASGLPSFKVVPDPFFAPDGFSVKDFNGANLPGFDPPTANNFVLSWKYNTE